MLWLLTVRLESVPLTEIERFTVTVIVDGTALGLTIVIVPW